MKTIKFLLKIASFLLLCITVSCDSGSGDNDNPDSGDFYIKAKVDGQQVTVNWRPQALFQGGPDIYALQLYAGNSLSNVYPFFSFDIDNITQVTTGTYSEATHITLFQFYSSDQKGYGDYDINETNDFSLQITEVTNSYIKGVFQGVLWEETGLTETITVTEGSFYLPRYYGEYGNTNPN